MIEDRRKEQASLYALETLPEAEVNEFEKAVQTDADLKQLVTELQSALDMMVFAFPRISPPDELKPKILHQLDHREAPSHALLGSPVSEGRRGAWFPWTMAAMLAVACLVFFTTDRLLREQVTALNLQKEALTGQVDELSRQRDSSRNQGNQKSGELQQQLTDLQQRLQQSTEKSQTDKTGLQSDFEQKLSDLEKEKAALKEQVEAIAEENERLTTALKAAQAELLAAQSRNALSQVRVGMLTSLVESAPKAVATTVWDTEQQKGLLLAENLAPIAADSDYQLWLIDARYPNPINAGIFKTDAQGNARVNFKTDFRVDTVDKFAVTLERRGGSVRPQGKTVLVSN